MNIAVDSGHSISGPGSGAVGIISESKCTREVGDVVRRLLKEAGNHVINATIDHANSTSEQLAGIVANANREDLDWFVSIHFNSGGGNGVEVYTYKGRQYPDALAVCKNISALGIPNRGVKEGTGLYVIRKTKAKSMLIEVCFVDTSDADWYKKTGPEKIGKAIVEAILGEVVPSKPIKPDVKPEPSKPASKELWEVSISGSLVKRLQEAINDQGYGRIKCDGYFGETTLEHCPMVKPGARGEITKIIQQRLVDLGYKINGGVDGIFGKYNPNTVAVTTEGAIRSLQKKHGIGVDGIVGRNTWKALMKK